MTQTTCLEWGYHPGLPENTPAAWGARAIFKNGKYSLLPDRQSLFGDPKATQYILSTLKRHAKRLEKAVYSAWNDFQLPDREANEVTVALPGLTVKVNTNGSMGYLYMVAYPTPTGTRGNDAAL